MSYYCYEQITFRADIARIDRTKEVLTASDLADSPVIKRCLHSLVSLICIVNNETVNMHVYKHSLVGFRFQLLYNTL